MDTVVRRRGLLGVSNRIWRDPRTWLVLLAVTEKSIFRYFMLALSMFTGFEDIGYVVLHAAYIILIGLCLSRGSKIRTSDLLVLLFVILSILLTWLIYPDNIEKYMFGKEQFWPTVFPLFRFFIVGLFLIPDEETVDLMGKVSCLAVLAETLFALFILRGSELQENDDMSRAYFILLNVLLVINYAFDRKTLLGLVFAAVSVMFLLSMGTRGPIMVLLSFIAAKILQTSMKKGRGYIVIIVLAFLMWFVNSDYWYAFLLFLREIIDSLGFSTRVLDFTIEGETLTYYSERDEIFEIVLNKIRENPIFGYGVYGEWQFVNWFAHNTYLEILSNFGVILGGAIILWMFYITFKAFFATNYSPIRGLVLLFACQVFARGIFGGPFLSSGPFLLFGFCLQIMHKSNFKYLPFTYDKTGNSGRRLQSTKRHETTS